VVTKYENDLTDNATSRMMKEPKSRKKNTKKPTGNGEREECA
jgi:hypothetical protein